MATVIIWAIALLLLSNLITSQIAWRFGVKNGEKWERYRWETKAETKRIGGVDVDNPHAPENLKVLNIEEFLHGRQPAHSQVNPEQSRPVHRQVRS